MSKTIQKLGQIYKNSSIHAHRRFSKVDHMLGHKTGFQILKDWYHIKNVLWSQLNEPTTEIGIRRKTRKFTNTWKWNNTLLNHQWVNKEEITRAIRKYFKKCIKIKTQRMYCNLWDTVKAVNRRKIYIYKCLH